MRHCSQWPVKQRTSSMTVYWPDSVKTLMISQFSRQTPFYWVIGTPVIHQVTFLSSTTLDQTDAGNKHRPWPIRSGKDGQGSTCPRFKKDKWLSRRPNLVPKDLVLILDQDQPRGHWPLGLVKETFPDSQGCIRQVVVRTANQKHLRRDVRKICLLEKAQWDLNSAVIEKTVLLLRTWHYMITVK